MKYGRSAFGHKKSNGKSLFGEMREYSDLYQAADAAKRAEQAKRDEAHGIVRHEAKVENMTFRWTEKVETPLDRLFKQKRTIKSQISALCEKRDIEGLSREEQQTLNGLFKDLKKVNNDPLMVAVHKELDIKNAKKAFEVEVYDLYLKDTRFLPKERDQFLAKRKDIIKDSKFEFDGNTFAFVRCKDTIQYHWVKL